MSDFFWPGEELTSLPAKHPEVLLSATGKPDQKRKGLVTSWGDVRRAQM